MITDTIQQAIAARAESLGLSASEISRQCGGSPNPEAVRRYLTGRCGLGSLLVSQICGVLQLELKPTKRVKQASVSDHE